MHLICGLGNPGRKYSNTRHNIGFMVVDKLIESFSLNIKDSFKKFNGEYLSIKTSDYDFITLKPQTYMNLSGECIRDFVNFYKVPLENILIICDDINLPFGKIRFRAKGSDGGHNGLKSIFSNLNTTSINRLRVGIGNSTNKDLADYVLEAFNNEESLKLPEILSFCVEGIKCFLKSGIQAAMNEFNNKIGYKIES